LQKRRRKEKTSIHHQPKSNKGKREKKATKKAHASGTALEGFCLLFNFILNSLVWLPRGGRGGGVLIHFFFFFLVGDMEWHVTTRLDQARQDKERQNMR